MANVMIIGAGPGLGRALAQAFAATGASITLLARGEEGICAIADELRATGTPTLTLSADVRDEDALRAAVSSSLERFGTPDVLIYNAAIIQQDALGQLTAADHEHAWGVNVVGALTAVAAIAPSMQHRGSGSILLTGGLPTPQPNYLSLSLGKAGVRALTAMLAEQLGPTGVHVATVTVGGPVVAGTALDPHEIAGHYVRLHAQAVGQWQHEVLLPGPAG